MEVFLIVGDEATSVEPKAVKNSVRFIIFLKDAEQK
jgi:hypothetical protein